MTDTKVQPCENIPAQVIDLSVPDAAAPKHWPMQLMIWQLEDRNDFVKSYEHLKDGLGRLLVEVPALVGNLARSKEDPRKLTVTIQDGAFVDFPFEDLSAIEAVPSFDDLQRSGFPTTGLKVPLSPKTSLGPLVEGSPMMCIKLSQIKGGAVLAFGFSHVLADGAAVAELSRLWALHTAQVSDGVAFQKHKTVTPDEEIRTRLSTPPKLNTGTTLDPFLQITPSKEATNFLHKDVASAERAKRRVAEEIMARLTVIEEKREPQSFAIWKLTPDKLKELKHDASSSDQDWISTMDALAGLFWSRIAHIQSQSAKGYEKSNCIFALNIRQRLQPPVSHAYIGNCFSPVDAECSLKEMESEVMGLKAAAQSMRRANKDWNQPRWDAWLNKIIDLPMEQTLDTNHEFVLEKHNMRFNDYSAFQLNILNWGAPLGQVARSRCLRSALPGGAPGVWVYPRLPDGTLEVWLTCNDSLRQSLLEDPVFRRYADFVCHHL